MSSRSALRHQSAGRVPSFKLRLLTCLDDQGKLAIEKNMEDGFNKEILSTFFEMDNKFLAHLLVDGVAVDPGINVDLSQLLHEFTGICMHCISTCLDDQGKLAIEKNMEDVFNEEILLTFFEMDYKVLACLLFDGVAVDPGINIDLSQLPKKFTGICMHCKNTSFVTFEDAKRISFELDRDVEDPEKIHLAKEVEVWCIGLNDKKNIFLVPVALIPTCKKDYQIDELTSTIATIGKIIIDRY